MLYQITKNQLNFHFKIFTQFRFLLGIFTHRQLTRYIITFYITYCSFITAALVCFDINAYNTISKPYDFLRHPYSKLGSCDMSPYGWVFFSVGMCFYGAAVQPIFTHIFRQLYKINKTLSILSLIFNTVGGVGVILVGLFPDYQSKTVQNSQRLHNIMSSIAFGGLLIAPYFELPVVLIGKRKRVQFLSKYSMVPFILIILDQLFYFTVYDLYSVVWQKYDPMNEWWFQYPPWEWSLVVALVGTVGWTALAVGAGKEVGE